VPLVAHAARHPERIAIVTDGDAFSYRQLNSVSQRVAAALMGAEPDLAEARVAFLVPPGFDWASVLWGIWRAGGIAVPLALSHPPAELEHVIRDAQASIVVADPAYVAMLERIAQDCCARFYTTADLQVAASTREPQIAPERRALMLYTSGTTGKPKGVVHTHASLAAQVTSLVSAWAWSADDRTLLVLPLHHVHGIVNVVACALWSGATCEMMARFDADATWARMASGELTVFMAVPTLYHKMIASWDAASAEQQQARSQGARRLRLMVSGSAALPVQTLERWRQITGHTLLERYGMTEIGMALANPLHGERRPGYVGTPLPGVEVRIVDDRGQELAPGSAGEIEVRGATVFLEYWQNTEATRSAFHAGTTRLPLFPPSSLPDFPWFRTGDVGVIEERYYRILGRTSIDIIKTGGYKVSALEIEEVLRMHPAVSECAVVAVPDAEWGERVCAAVELRANQELTLHEMQSWARDRLAPYKIPRSLRCVPALPRNAMGKVVKPDVKAMFA
jgi:malonyl-CoA/methylmalonyl-CoA synthetase